MTFLVVRSSHFFRLIYIIHIYQLIGNIFSRHPHYPNLQISKQYCLFYDLLDFNTTDIFIIKLNKLINDFITYEISLKPRKTNHKGSTFNSRMFEKIKKKIHSIKNKKKTYENCLKEYISKTSFHGLHYIIDVRKQLLDL